MTSWPISTRRWHKSETSRCKCLQFESPWWVKSAVLTLNQPLPVYPDQRTSTGRPSVSVSCHEQTFGIQYFHALQAGCYSHLLIHRNEARRQRCYRAKRCREGRSRDCEDARI